MFVWFLKKQNLTKKSEKAPLSTESLLMVWKLNACYLLFLIPKLPYNVGKFNYFYGDLSNFPKSQVTKWKSWNYNPNVGCIPNPLSFQLSQAACPKKIQEKWCQ
jgi:hypothetical protein